MLHTVYDVRGGAWAPDIHFLSVLFISKVNTFAFEKTEEVLYVLTFLHPTVWKDDGELNVSKMINAKFFKHISRQKIPLPVSAAAETQKHASQLLKNRGSIRNLQTCAAVQSYPAAALRPRLNWLPVGLSHAA